MMSRDTAAAFSRIPWASRLLAAPNLTVETPFSRDPKASTEDSLLAITLKTPETITACVAFYERPRPGAQEHITSVSTLTLVGDGLNGHPRILHGGITAMLIDEGMGIYLGVNLRAFPEKVYTEANPLNATSFTADLKIKYLRPVQTPGAVLVTASRLKAEGRKEWIKAEVKQWVDGKDGKEGELAVCATAEGLFITPRGAAISSGRGKL